MSATGLVRWRSSVEFGGGVRASKPAKTERQKELASAPNGGDKEEVFGLRHR